MSSAASPSRHLTDFLRRHGHALVILFFGLLLPLPGCVKIAQEVFEKEPFAFEEPLMLAVHAGSSNLLSRLAVGFSLLGSAKGMAPLGLLLVAVLYRVRRRLAYFVALSLGSVTIINVLLKNLFDRPRPAFWTPVLPEPDFSFPSGHAMFASALATAIVAILWPTRWRVPALILGTPLRPGHAVVPHLYRRSLSDRRGRGRALLTGLGIRPGPGPAQPPLPAGFAAPGQATMIQRGGMGSSSLPPSTG